VSANALVTGQPGADTTSLLHRYGLGELAKKQPDEAVRQLHKKAVATGGRDLLFALAEMSFVTGDQIRRSVKPWEPRDPRDYYLGSAVYAWLFLFGPGEEPPPSPFDRRFREACDFYNYCLGLALTERRGTNAVVELINERRRLPVGELELQLSQSATGARLQQFDQFLLADQFRVHGLSVRTRGGGVGAPLIAVPPADASLKFRRAQPATVLLRIEGSLADLAARPAIGLLEFYAPAGKATVTIGQTKVPLEVDLTAFRAWTLNQAKIWKLGPLAFMAPAEHIRSQLILNQPYEPGKIPVVFVHGTFSSPVTWAEMGNSLSADPVLSQQYMMWTFIYGSGNPLAQSIADLRKILTAEVQRLDPAGTNAALRQMVVIGHSQGGLVTKGTAVDTGDRVWKIFSTNRLENLKITDEKREELRRFLFLEPLPFVKRVVFIATPHHGSYLAGGFVRRWAQRLVALPGALVSRGNEMLMMTEGSEAGKFFKGRLPTSLDSMSPVNPVLLAMADLPVSPAITAHSIIAVRGDGDYRQGKDGLVSYSSAHVDYAASECIVHHSHTCLDEPATIEEVRRILLEHLASQPPQPQPDKP
jgi:pimeloyl-ACP methyl ester carboxylesterase